MGRRSAGGAGRGRRAVRSQLGWWALLLLVFALAALQVHEFGSKAADLIRARSWSQTTGSITASGYTTTTRQERRTLGDPGQGNFRTVTTATPDTVAFRFEVAGRTYESETPSFFQRWTIGKNSPRYPEGLAVPVYYDPAAPSNAVLVRTPDSGFFVCLGVMLYALFMLVGALLNVSRVRGAASLLGGGLVVGVGLLLILGALVSSTDRPVAAMLAIGALGFLPVFFGSAIAISPWRRVPGSVGALVMLGSFITVIVGVILAG